MSTVAKVSLDNSASASNALTNQLVIVPLSTSRFNFAAVNSDGRNLDVLDANGVTSLTHSLRTWKTGTGLYLDSVLAAPAIDNGHTLASPTCIVTGNLGLANDPHTIWGVGTSINDPNPSYGVWNCYDKFNTLVWSFRSASQDYPMSVDIGDLAGDGSDPVVAVGARNQDFTGYLLNANGTTRWHYTITGSYIRTAKIGKLTANAGNQVLFGGAAGKLALLDKLGNQLWLNTYPDDGSGPTMQGAVIDDLSNTGTNSIYVTQGRIVRKISGAGSTVWSRNVGLSIAQTGYAIASGHITSLTTKQVVVPSAGPFANSIMGTITVIDDTGAIAWQKCIPFGSYTLTCGDVNGDGYDEVIVQWSAAPEFTNDNGWGGILVLDRNGQELALTSMVGGSTFIRYADWDGSGIKGVETGSSFVRMYRYRFDNQGASIKANVPSIAASTVKTAFLASTASATLIPALGDFAFNLSGADGSSPPNMNQRVGAWTIQSHTLQSPSEGDTGSNDAIEFNGVSSDGLEFEFDFVKNDQGTGTAADYYAGLRYRCNTWSAGSPNCFLLAVGAKGHCTLNQLASGTGSVVETLFTTAASGLTFNTTDIITIRVVVAGYDHSAQFRKNGGPWTLLYRVLDSSGSPLSSAGTFALYNNRGQTRYSNLKLFTLPSVYGSGPPGPAPLVSIVVPTTATLTGPATALVGVQAGPYTVTLDIATPVNCVVTPAGSGSGTFQASLGGSNVSTVTIPAGSTSVQFWLTPTATGTDSLTITTSPTLTYPGSPLAVNVGSFYLPSASQSYALLENNSRILAESGIGSALLETTLGAATYPLMESRFHFLLESSVGSIALEEFGGISIRNPNPFASTVALVSADPFGSTARLKGN